VSYKNFVHGVGASLACDKKDFCSPFPFHVGDYGFKYVKEAISESRILITFHFGEGWFMRNDPLDIVNQDYHTCKYR
jgi:hypothetical protein